MSDDHKQLEYEINVRGDKPMTLDGQHGTDISSGRLGEIDKAAIKYVLDHTNPHPVGLDVGCGLAFPSIAMALAGAQMTLVDVADLSKHFADLAALLPTDRLCFIQKDAKDLTAQDIPASLDFLYAQRTLHYLPYADALTFLKFIFGHMNSGAMVYVSISGIKTELSEGYEGVSVPVGKRFFKLAPAMAAKHQINEPLCLYAPDEFKTLFESAGFVLQGSVMSGTFGNLKGIFVRP